MTRIRRIISLKDVHQAVAQMRAYWDEGRLSVEAYGSRVRYGHSSEKIRKARVFFQRYNKSQLDRLCEKCLKHNSFVGTSFIDRLATIRSVRDRTLLESKLITENWSRARLDREIHLRYGSRRKLGRSPIRPSSPDEALAEIVRLCTKMTRWGRMMGWCEQAGRDDAVGDTSKISFFNLPPEIVREAEKTLRVVQSLQITAESALAEKRQ